MPPHGGSATGLERFTVLVDGFADALHALGQLRLELARDGDVQPLAQVADVGAHPLFEFRAAVGQNVQPQRGHGPRPQNAGHI